MKTINKQFLLTALFTVGISIFLPNHIDAEGVWGNNATATVTTNAKTKVIVVKKGDTLYSLAKTYQTTIEMLKDLNKLNSNHIKVGQKLKVPVATSTSKEVTLKLQKGFTLEKEEPGKTVLLYSNDTSYFARIEVLDKDATLKAVKKEAMTYLKSTGKVLELDGSKSHKFYKGAEFFLHASNSKVSQNLVVKRVGDRLVKFTIHFPNKEASEGITPLMIEMLTTLTLK